MDSELLMAYLDGDLSPLDRGRVAEHIVACDACRATVNDLRQVSELLGRWEVPEPDGLPEAGDLLARAGSVVEAPPAPPSFSGISRRWAAAAALAVAASIIGLLSLPMFLSRESAEAPSVAQAPSTPPEAGGTRTQETPPAPASDAVTPPEPAPEPQAAPAQPGEPAAEPEADAKNEVPAAGEEKSSPLGGFVGTIGEAPKAAAPADTEAVTSQAAPPPPPPAPAVVGRDDMARSETAPAAGAAETRKRAAAPRRDARGTTLIRRANLDLAGDPQALADRVGAVAGGAGGRVVSRSRLGRSGAVRVTLEVPAERFEQVYEQLKGLGTVRRETRWNNDISDRLEQIEQELSDGDERGQRPSKSQLESERVDLLERARKGTVVVTISAP